MRLPIESAKKLRWFDRQDLNMLIQLHLREKQELYEANAALRQALLRTGADADPTVQHTNAAVDSIKADDAAVNEVLLLGAQAEIERLQELGHLQQSQLKAMQQRLASHQQQQVTVVAEQLQQHGAPAPTPRDVLQSFVLLMQAEGRGERDEVEALLIEQAAATLGKLAASHGLEVYVAEMEATTGEARSGDFLNAEGEDFRSPQKLGGRARPTTPQDAAVRLASPAGHLLDRCAKLESQVIHLQSELASAQQENSLLQETENKRVEVRNGAGGGTFGWVVCCHHVGISTNAHPICTPHHICCNVQEVKARFSATQQSQQELLRVAQDGRLAAEGRIEEAEARAEEADARVAQLEADCSALKVGAVMLRLLRIHCKCARSIRPLHAGT